MSLSSAAQPPTAAATNNQAMAESVATGGVALEHMHRSYEQLMHQSNQQQQQQHHQQRYMHAAAAAAAAAAQNKMNLYNGGGSMSPIQQLHNALDGLNRGRITSESERVTSHHKGYQQQSNVSIPPPQSGHGSAGHGAYSPHASPLGVNIPPPQVSPHTHQQMLQKQFYHQMTSPQRSAAANMHSVSPMQRHRHYQQLPPPPPPQQQQQLPSQQELPPQQQQQQQLPPPQQQMLPPPINNQQHQQQHQGNIVSPTHQQMSPHGLVGAGFSPLAANRQHPPHAQQPQLPPENVSAVQLQDREILYSKFKHFQQLQNQSQQAHSQAPHQVQEKNQQDTQACHTQEENNIIFAPSHDVDHSPTGLNAKEPVLQPEQEQNSNSGDTRSEEGSENAIEIKEKSEEPPIGHMNGDHHDGGSDEKDGNRQMQYSDDVEMKDFERSVEDEDDKLLIATEELKREENEDGSQSPHSPASVSATQDKNEAEVNGKTADSEMKIKMEGDEEQKTEQCPRDNLSNEEDNDAEMGDEHDDSFMHDSMALTPSDRDSEHSLLLPAMDGSTDGSIGEHLTGEEELKKNAEFLAAMKQVESEAQLRNNTILEQVGLEAAEGMVAEAGTEGMTNPEGQQPKAYQCKHCSYSGSSKFHFNSHMNTHFDHKCNFCDYVSRTEGRLKRHIKDSHNDVPQELQGNLSQRVARNPNPPQKLKTYKCKQCEFSCTNKNVYWDHARSHIKAEKLLSCPKCPFVTEYKHHLEYHLRNHFGSKPFKCNKCNYACVNKSMLNSHMKSHSNLYQYRCLDCTYATKYCHSLKLHLRKYNHKPATVMNTEGTPPSTTSSIDFFPPAKKGRSSKKTPDAQNKISEPIQQLSLPPVSLPLNGTSPMQPQFPFPALMNGFPNTNMFETYRQGLLMPAARGDGPLQRGPQPLPPSRAHFPSTSLATKHDRAKAKTTTSAFTTITLAPPTPSHSERSGKT